MDVDADADADADAETEMKTEAEMKTDADAEATTVVAVAKATHEELLDADAGAPSTRAWRRVGGAPAAAYHVTWCCGNAIDHLVTRFRNVSTSALGLVIVAKTPGSRCESLSAELWERVWMCANVPNSQGREVDAMAWYARQAYDDLPRMTLFEHEDKILYPSMKSFVNALREGEERGDVRDVVEARARRLEAELRRGLEGDVDPETAPRVPLGLTEDALVAERVLKEKLAGYAYNTFFSIFLRTFFNVGLAADDPALVHEALGDRIEWPQTASFAATSEMIRSRSRSFWEALVRLSTCDGKLTSFSSEYVAALEWAHTLERGWIPIVFNPHLRERPIADYADCLLDPLARCYEVVDAAANASKIVRYDAALFGNSVMTHPLWAETRGLRVENDPKDVVSKCGENTWSDHANHPRKKIVE